MAKRRIGGYTTTREVYKTVKKYDHQQFDEFCTRIYADGFNDGKKSVISKENKEKKVRNVAHQRERCWKIQLELYKNIGKRFRSEKRK